MTKETVRRQIIEIDIEITLPNGATPRVIVRENEGAIVKGDQIEVVESRPRAPRPRAIANRRLLTELKNS